MCLSSSSPLCYLLSFVLHFHDHHHFLPHKKNRGHHVIHNHDHGYMIFILLFWKNVVGQVKKVVTDVKALHSHRWSTLQTNSHQMEDCATMMNMMGMMMTIFIFFDVNQIQAQGGILDFSPFVWSDYQYQNEIKKNVNFCRSGCDASPTVAS